MLEGNLLGGPIIKGLKGEVHHQHPHHIPLEIRACSLLGQPLLLVVQRHSHHPTPNRVTASIPDFTTLPTQMVLLHDPHPTPRRERDCIRRYRNPLLLQLSMSPTDTREVRYLTPQKPVCLSQVPWTKFGEEEFSVLKGNLGYSGEHNFSARFW